MHPRQLPSSTLTRLTTAHAGVVTREQATALGLSRHAVQRLIDASDWVPVARGIYLTAPTVSTWPALAGSGILIGGNGARLGGEAAAYRAPAHDRRAEAADHAGASPS
jgi:hypothetical protein